MPNEMRRKTGFKYGFKPNQLDTTIRFLAKFFIKLFRLDKNGKFATEVCQHLKPTASVDFLGKKLKFMTGHGRLLWRVKTFHTEEPMMIDWLKTFRENDVFCDIGANVGTYSIPAATVCSKVIAVELDPANIYCLHSNICLNDISEKCVIIPLASSNTRELSKIFYRDFSIGDALQSVGREQVLPTNKPNPFIATQLTAPLDDIFVEYKLPTATKIKIDVDGNEELVTSGAWTIIKNAEEIYFEDNGMHSDLEIIEKMKSFGFKIYKETPSIVGSVKSDIARNLLLKKSV